MKKILALLLVAICATSCGNNAVEVNIDSLAEAVVSSLEFEDELMKIDNEREKSVFMIPCFAKDGKKNSAAHESGALDSSAACAGPPSSVCCADTFPRGGRLKAGCVPCWRFLPDACRQKTERAFPFRQLWYAVV